MLAIRVSMLSFTSLAISRFCVLVRPEECPV
jgi:hypothetical protein